MSRKDEAGDYILGLRPSRIEMLYNLDPVLEAGAKLFGIPKDDVLVMSDIFHPIRAYKEGEEYKTVQIDRLELPHTKERLEANRLRYETATHIMFLVGRPKKHDDMFDSATKRVKLFYECAVKWEPIAFERSQVEKVQPKFEMGEARCDDREPVSKACPHCGRDS